tara:strand:+ start:443 stop:670 length:228 start_codon:yes stop_codon:yes gene_type:complete
MKLGVSCPTENNDCRYWINYEDDLNCTFVAIYNNGPMTLREVAAREGISHVRVSQIEEKILGRMKKKFIKHGFDS